MKPIKFKGQNVTYAENQDDYQNLPALRIPGPEGHVISCWKLSRWERLKILFSGRVWLDLMTFNGPLQPIYMDVTKTKVFTLADDRNQKWFSWFRGTTKARR